MWNAGEEVYVMGLDISKAFDNISLKDLPKILIQKHVSPELAARVVECVREETFQTLWNGQRSPSVLRKMGIKQGCPLSPYLFDLIMEEILKRVEKELLGLFVVDQRNKLRFPIVLVYADDVLILANQKEQLERIMPSLEKSLLEDNLTLNRAKTKLLIRAPLGDVPVQLMLNGVNYEVAKELMYLGVVITERLCRPKTMKTRCRKAIVASKVVINFAKRNQPSVEVGRLLYDTLIAPTLLYGSQISVLTKRSRTSLRKYERQIAEELAKCCTDPEENDGRKILNGKTITKKVRALQMRYWSHVVRKEDYTLLKIAAKYKKNHKKRGRPSFTWLDIIKQNMDRYADLTQEQWESLAQERDKVRTKIDQIYNLTESSDSES